MVQVTDLSQENLRLNQDRWSWRQAKGFQERLDELSDHINPIEMMLDEIGKEFDGQMEFLNTLKELKK